MTEKTEIIINRWTKIPTSELVFRFSRSGGPGGQNVNKLNTKVSLHFDVVQSDSLDHEQKRVILERLANRISKKGVLLLVASEHRTQQANKASAIERLQNLLSQALHQQKKRQKTRPTKGSREKRLQSKHKRSMVKQQRKKPGNNEKY